MTIYDCFLFFNELDLLELRLKELNDSVDVFFITESIYTFRGTKKPEYIFEKNKERFKKWLEKIHYFKIDNIPFNCNEDAEKIREHEHWQREEMRTKILNTFNIRDNDVIIISDLDEIPRKNIVNNYKSSDGPCSIEMTHFMFFINSKDKHLIWNRCKIIPGYTLKNNTIRYIRWHTHDIWVKISNGGWHFSSCGPYEIIENKINSFAHCLDKHNPNMLKKIKDKILVKEESYRFDIIEIDSSYPLEIYLNIEKWKNMGFIYYS